MFNLLYTIWPVLTTYLNTKISLPASNGFLVTAVISQAKYKFCTTNTLLLTSCIILAFRKFVLSLKHDV
jgi:hypothetical protein